MIGLASLIYFAVLIWLAVRGAPRISAEMAADCEGTAPPIPRWCADVIVTIGVVIWPVTLAIGIYGELKGPRR